MNSPTFTSSFSSTEHRRWMQAVDCIPMNATVLFSLLSWKVKHERIARWDLASSITECPENQECTLDVSCSVLEDVKFAIETWEPGSFKWISMQLMFLRRQPLVATSGTTVTSMLASVMAAICVLQPSGFSSLRHLWNQLLCCFPRCGFCGQLS